MIEVEIKVKVSDKEKLISKLIQLGFHKGTISKEADIYFNSDYYNLKEKDMALRIRSCKDLTSGTCSQVITYKGPKMDDISMTRKELETEIGDASVCKEILISLGYHPVYPVIKKRKYYHKEELTACLDQVENLGDYLELEIIVPNEREKENALKHIVDILAHLGYKKEDIIRTSYLSLLQNKHLLSN